LGIVSCLGCDQKLRVPDGKRGTVSCPRCGAEWFYPDAVELSEVEFRCSMSGARFYVMSARRSPLHKFAVQKIRKAAVAPSSRASDETGAPTSEQPALQARAPLQLPDSSRVGGWLARIVGRKADVVASAPPPSAELPKGKAPRAPEQVVAYDAHEYNWNGFSCPYCGVSSFVSCVGGHLACDGTVESRDGRRFHQCFCGEAGFIGPPFKTLKGRRLSIEGEIALPKKPDAGNQAVSERPADAALPPPLRR
jgi:hypothetical protein